MVELLRILLVEDNPDDVEILCESVAEAGCKAHVETVDRLADAVSLLERSRFDLVLLDLSLLDSQGMDTLDRALAAEAGVPIVVLTGLEDEALGASAVQHGAQDYLVKGRLDPLGLIRCMRYAVERHRLLQAQREDAAVAAALARAGEALLEAPTGPALVDRLCDLAISEIHSEAAYVWIFDRDSAQFAPAAARPPEAWQRIGGKRLPEGAVSALEGRLQGDGVIVLTADLREQLPAEMLPFPSDTPALVLLLAQGGELIGVQVCQNPRTIADEVTLRITRDFLDLATLALSNARLVDELERSNTVKTYYAATMTHELRNTLFAVGGLAEMLAEKLASERSDLSRLAEAIHARTKDSLAVIQASLELTSSSVRQGGEAVEEVVLPELLAQIAREIHVPGSKAGLRVEWDVPDTLPAVHTDAIKLSMVLRNLVNNAVKFTDEGVVQVSVRPLEGAVVFVVSDTGIGIPSTELEILFQPFRQVHGLRSRRAGGAGLGLYIVGRLVEILGGQIAVESEAERGTRFTLTLPLRPQAA